MKITVTLTFKRETKGSILYEATEPGPIQNIYIKKAALQDPWPTKVLVGVEA